jgi:hypothetical protein
MRKVTYLSGLLLALLVAACTGSGQPSSLESRQIDDLETRFAALEAQLAAQPDPTAEPHADNTDGDAFGVAVTQYILDTAGFHDMEEALAANETVDPAHLTTVNRVRKVVAQAPWPEALHEQANAFVVVLTEFAAALEADDGGAAAELAASAHTAQHDLSHAIDNWLGSGHGDAGHED